MTGEAGELLEVVDEEAGDVGDGELVVSVDDEGEEAEVEVDGAVVELVVSVVLGDDAVEDVCVVCVASVEVGTTEVGLEEGFHERLK